MSLFGGKKKKEAAQTARLLERLDGRELQATVRREPSGAGETMIGKGGRAKPVVDAIMRNGAVYFCAIGGAGAAISGCIKKVEVLAFEELGCESLKRLTIENMPVVCTIDSTGQNQVELGRAEYEVKD